MSLEEQVDKDFTLARRKALLRRIGARLRRNAASDGLLLCFDQVRQTSGAVGRVYRGMRTVPVGQIGGGVGRCSEFDRNFMPTKASSEERWKRTDRAFHRGEELPPVSLFELYSLYFVLDGHNRVSVARYHGVEWIDAEITEFHARLPEALNDGGGTVSRGTRGSEAIGMMDPYEAIMQHREAVAREVEQNRLAGELRRSRSRRASDGHRGSALTWELKRIAGRLSKLFGPSSYND